MAAPVARYKRRVYQWDAIQYDGLNGAEVIAFAGGSDYAKEAEAEGGGLKIVLSLQGSNIQSQKLDLMPTQWLLIPLRRAGEFNVVGESEFNALWQLDEPGPHIIQPV